jgi:hypothetical protein
MRVAGQEYEVAMRSGYRKVVAGEDDLAMAPEFCDWLRANGVEPEGTYQVDLHPKAIVVYQFHRVDGKSHVRCRCPHVSYLTDEIVWETECGWQITVPGASDAPKLLLTEGDQEVCRVAPFGVPCKVPPKDEWLA